MKKFFSTLFTVFLCVFLLSAQQSDSEKKNIKGDEWKNTNQEKQVQPSASRKNAIEQTEKNIPAQTQTLNDTVAIISSRKKP